MQLTMDEAVFMARLVKAGQAAEKEESEPKPKRKKPKRTKPDFTAAYPDYSRSLVTQRRRKPVVAGAQRALGTGSIGAVLGALIARLLGGDAKATLAGAASGGVLGGVPGYISGSEQAKSDYTKLLALRRMGIQTPAEYEHSLTFPQLVDRLTAEGYRL